MNMKLQTQTSYCPSEDVEESNLKTELDERGYVHWHVPNDMWTQSWKQKAHNTALGVISGVSDHWIRIKNWHGGYSLLILEMKRQFGNEPTDKQIQFILQMNEIDNVQAVQAYGCDEALKIIEELEHGCFDTVDRNLKKIERLRKNREKRRKIPKKSEKTKNDLPY